MESSDAKEGEMREMTERVRSPAGEGEADSSQSCGVIRSALPGRRD